MIIEQLRKAVIDSGKTQLAIAEATGIGQPNLSRFIKGKRCLSEANLNTLAKYLKLKLVRR